MFENFDKFRINLDKDLQEDEILIETNLDDEEIDDEKFKSEMKEFINKMDRETEIEHSIPQVTYRKGYIKFKDIPTSMDNPIKIIIESEGVTIPAIFDVNKCSSNDILKEGVLYDIVISTYHGDDKTYLSTYNECRDRGVRNPIERLMEGGAPDRVCAAKLGNGPKIKISTIANAYNVEKIYNDTHFVLCNDDITYRGCRLMELDEDDECDKLEIKAGEKYALSGIMNKVGLFIYEAIPYSKAVIHDEDDEQMKVIGETIFVEYPDPKSRLYEFEIFYNGKNHKAKIDRYNMESNAILRDDAQYGFTYTLENGTLNVTDYNAIGGLGSNDSDDVIDYIGDKIFVLGCLEKERHSECSAIELVFNAKPTRIKRISENITTFKIKQGSYIYDCVYDRELSPKHEEIDFNEKSEYVFDTVFVADKVYIKTAREIDEHSEKVAKSQGSEFAKKISKMSQSAKKEIISIVEKCEKNELIDEVQLECFNSLPELKLKYDLLKEYYPKEVQKAIADTLNNRDLKGGQKNKILDSLINATWGQKIEVKTEHDELKKALDEKFYGQEALKNEIIKTILSFKYKKKNVGIRVLLVGAPGVGKTSMFKYAAKCAGIPFEKISLNGISTPHFLGGTPRLYENAIPGAIMRCIRKIGNRAVIMLDEVDKMSEGNDGNPYTCLYNLLDRDEMFEDMFIENGIDLSDIIFVLTANDTTNIPTPILDRVTEISISDYTPEEKCVIAKDYVIKEEMANYEWEKKKLLWDEAVIDDIANKYTLNGGVRDIQKNVNKIVRNAFHKMIHGNLSEYVVNKENLFELIDITSCKREDIKYDIAGIKAKFLFYKYEYSEETRKEIMHLFTKYNTLNDGGEKELIRKCLAYMVNILPDKHPKEYSLSKVKESLDSSHYGMEDAKEPILSYIATKNIDDESCAKCLWLNGPYGVGKTTIAKAIAEAMGRKFVKVSLNGITHPEHIKGFEKTWKDATCGKIIEELSKAGTDNVLILLDEIDKMKGTYHGDPYSALLDLLDDSALFTDSFLGIPIDVSNIFFIATSNDADNVPPAIQDRMERVELSGYTSKEKTIIASKYVAEKKLTQYKIKESVVSPNTIEKLIKDYCKAYGIRDADRTLDKVFREYIKKSQLGEKIKKIDFDFVQSVLGAKPLKRGNVAENSVSGVTRALAVSGNYGTTFAVQVVENPYSDSDEITGLPKQSTLDSIKIAKLLVSKMLKKELPNLHIHFGEGGIEKDGPSAGITIFAAIYSALTGINVDRGIGMTGEIDIMGNVWPIGGLELKLTAAENEGCTKVFVPIDNYRQLEANGKLDNYELEIIPLKTVFEICDILFKDADAKKCEI